MSKSARFFQRLVVFIGLSAVGYPVPLGRGNGVTNPETVKSDGQKPDIPAASKPCSPEVAEWWEALRSAAKQLWKASRHSERGAS